MVSRRQIGAASDTKYKCRECEEVGTVAELLEHIMNNHDDFASELEDGRDDALHEFEEDFIERECDEV